MRVYVVRHGESETNVSKKWTGWQDVPLTERGQRDAERVGSLLREQEFDRIFTSDLSRSMDTAKIALPDKHSEPLTILREIDVGLLSNTPIAHLTQTQTEHIHKFGFSEFGGETQAHFEFRIQKFLKELENMDGQSIAVFTHAGWLRGMLDYVLSTYLPRKNICCDNCAVGVFDYKDGSWYLHSWINW